MNKTQYGNLRETKETTCPKVKTTVEKLSQEANPK